MDLVVWKVSDMNPLQFLLRPEYLVLVVVILGVVGLLRYFRSTILAAARIIAGQDRDERRHPEPTPPPATPDA